jgi:hypothetical protein
MRDAAPPEGWGLHFGGLDGDGRAAGSLIDERAGSTHDRVIAVS